MLAENQFFVCLCFFQQNLCWRVFCQQIQIVYMASFQSFCKYKQKTVHNCSIPSTHAERKITNLSDTLAARGLEEPFSSCAVVSVFWFLAGNRFWCYLLTYLEYKTVVALCQFFGSGNKQYLVLQHTYLVYNTLVRLCQLFGCGGKQCCGGKQFSK